MRWVLYCLVEDSLMDKVKYVNEGQNADFSRKTLRDLNRNAWSEISLHLFQLQLTDSLFLQILSEKEQLFYIVTYGYGR